MNLTARSNERGSISALKAKEKPEKFDRTGRRIVCSEEESQPVRCTRTLIKLLRELMDERTMRPNTAHNLTYGIFQIRHALPCFYSQASTTSRPQSLGAQKEASTVSPVVLFQGLNDGPAVPWRLLFPILSLFVISLLALSVFQVSSCVCFDDVFPLDPHFIPSCLCWHSPFHPRDACLRSLLIRRCRPVRYSDFHQQLRIIDSPFALKLCGIVAFIRHI